MPCRLRSPSLSLSPSLSFTHTWLVCVNFCSCCDEVLLLLLLLPCHGNQQGPAQSQQIMHLHTQAHTHTHTHTEAESHTQLFELCVCTWLFFHVSLFSVLFCWFLWGNASLSALGLPELAWVGLVWARLTSSYSIWARCRVNLARNIWQDDALPRCCLSAEQ